MYDRKEWSITMNVVVIGLGSMGKRRIRLMKEMYPNYKVVGVDGREDRRSETEGKYNIETFDTISKVKNDCCIDVAFVCTSPLSHNEIIRECLMNKWHVFCEINLVPDGYEENLKLSKEKGVVLFLSSTFLYREEIKIIRREVDKKSNLNYIYHIGQYLPDWHPWENYKDFFVGDKRTNGCREIMAIELPWIVSTFGKVENIHSLSNRMTKLNIDYDDNYIVQIQHDNGNKGVLIVDVVSPSAVRKLEVYGEETYIKWDGVPDSITRFDAETRLTVPVQIMEQTENMEGYSAFIVENAYKNEIREFFDVLYSRKEPIYGFEQDLEVLQLINRIGA